VALLAFVVLFFSVRPTPEWQPDWSTKLFFVIDPLVLLGTWLAAHAVPTILWASLGTVVVTIIFGRVFCGWICPLGAIHAVASRIFQWVWPNRKHRDVGSRWQLTKYCLLIGMLLMAAFGVHGVCVFDPLVFLYRSCATAVMPAGQWMAEEGSTAVYQADPGVGPLRVTSVTEPPYRFLRSHVFVLAKESFLGGGWIFLLFVATIVLNAYRPRFWCRYLCPLGALLGILAWRPWLRRSVNVAMCTRCDLCRTKCHGASCMVPGENWKASECFVCLNCEESCPREMVHLRWALPWAKEPKIEPINLGKRAMFSSALGGVVGMCLMRMSPQARGKIYNAALLRPPGARAEHDFLQRCTACGLCMKVCPQSALQPAIAEAGLEGIWTPRLVPRIGYCEYTCNLCGQVCPTEAIQPLPLEVKQKTRIGLASFDVSRCIPYAYGRECMVCEEHCPISDKAIYFTEVDVRQRDGSVQKIKQPHVDPEKCIGCGICENVCPYKDGPAIRVMSANESRHSENNPILPGATSYG
jgi:MauM/NapG family ferredoxin protein